MSPQAGELDEAPHPRITEVLFGHADTEAALLAAYRGGRVPHAFLLIGQKGIGKATLAYRMARFVLAHPDPAAPEVRAATSLAVAPQHPVARRVAAQAQGDLLVLERTLNEKGILRQQIAVEDVRRTVSFFGATAGRGDGGSRSSTRSTSSIGSAPTHSSRYSRNRHTAGCCSWCPIPQRVYFQRFARAVA